METAVKFFSDLSWEPGSIGILAIGILVGFFLTRRILQNEKLSLTDYSKLLVLYGGGGGVIAGLTGYLLEKKLFAHLDAYGIGLFAGFVFNVLLRISVAILEAVAHSLQKIAGTIRKITGIIIRFLLK